jgi:hypothetical protein
MISPAVRVCYIPGLVFSLPAFHTLWSCSGLWTDLMELLHIVDKIRINKKGVIFSFRIKGKSSIFSTWINNVRD